jgi:predicted metal-dependent hydrolase
MSAKQHSIHFGTVTIDFDLERRDRSTMAIHVHPDMSVEVIAPVDAELESIYKKVKKRAGWIVRQQDFFNEFLPPTPPRRYIGGETHKYLGRQYRLKIHECKDEAVKLQGRYFHVYTKDRTNAKRVKKLMDAWLREKALTRFETQIEELTPRFKRYKINVPEIKLQAMPKRWGSCHVNGTITLNPELIQAPRQCIEYVLVHELCHLVEPSHCKRFYRLLGRMLPDWEERKMRLEKANT